MALLISASHKEIVLGDYCSSFVLFQALSSLLCPARITRLQGVAPPIPALPASLHPKLCLLHVPAIIAPVARSRVSKTRMNTRFSSRVETHRHIYIDARPLFTRGEQISLA
jgi:hypothetical protein